MSAGAPAEDQPADSPSPRRFFCLRCRLWVAALLLILFAAGLAAVSRLPRLLDPQTHRALFEHALSRALGAKVTAGMVTADLRDGALAVRVDDLVILDDHEKPAISIRNIAANLALWPSGDALDVSSLAITRPEGRLLRRRDGTFNIPALETSITAANLELRAPARRLLRLFGVISITGGELRWTDNMISAPPVALTLSEFGLNVAAPRPGGRRELTCSARLSANDEAAGAFEIRGAVGTEKVEEAPEIAFEGSVKLHSLRAGPVWPYLDPLLPLQRLEGAVSLDAVVRADTSGRYRSRGTLRVASLAIAYRQAFSEGLRPEDVTIEHDVEGDLSRIALRRAYITLGGLAAHVTGEVGAMNTPNPRFTVSVSSNDMTVAELRQFIPEGALTAQQSAFFSGNLREGSVRLEGLSFAGDMEMLRHLDNEAAYQAASGGLAVNGVSLEFESLPHAFEGVGGAARLEGGRLRLSGLTGRYGDSQLTDVTGWVDRLAGWPVFDLHLVADLDIEQARQSIARRITNPQLRSHFDRVDETTGSLTLDMAVAGDTERLRETFTATGQMEVKDAGARSEEFGLPVRDINGSIEMNLRDLTIRSLTWQAGDSFFTFSGALRDVFLPEPSFDLALSARVELADLDSIRYVNLGPIYQRRGMARLDTKLTGAFANFTFANRLDLTDAGFRFSDLIDKRPGLTNVYTFDGAVQGQEKVVIRRLLVDVGSSRLEMNGHVGKFLRGEDIDLTISSQEARFDDLDRFTVFLDDIASSGSLAGSISLRLPAGEKILSMDGEVNVRGATFKLPIFESPFRNADGRFEFSGGKIFLRGGQGVFGDGMFTMEGSAALGGVNVFTLDARTTRLNLYDLFGAPEEAPAPPAPTEPEPPADSATSNPFEGRWTIRVLSGGGAIGPLTYSDLDTVIRYENDRFEIDPFVFSAHGGVWDWKGNITAVNAAMEFDSTIDIRDLDMAAYLTESAQYEAIAAGRLNLRGEVAGHGAKWRQIKKTLDGKFDVVAGPGVIRRFNLLSKIFSLLNLSQYFKLRLPDLAVEGMPFDGLMGSFQLASGVARTSDLLIESESMRLAAVGDYDVARNLVNMKVGVMPFIAVDRVISSIPLVGDVLTDERGSMITSYYAVEGPLDNPKVESTPLESIAVTIVGFFERLFKLPSVTWQKLKDLNRPADGAGNTRP